MNSANCPCDIWVHPLPNAIPAGLSQIPRQIATFPEFRRAMLGAIAQAPAFANWRGRDRDDLGIMLLEWWAYVCDVLAFYDAAIAHENYLRTARLRPSLRKLVNLLGYVPRPAVAASVRLAAIAEGRQPITLPAGTAFRSGAFAGNPPQVFELERATIIHPFNNQWTLDRVIPTTIGSGSDSISLTALTLNPATASVRVGDRLLIQVADKPDQTWVRRAIALTTLTDLDRQKYRRVTLNSAIVLPASTDPADLQLSSPSQTASLWTISGPGNPTAISGNQLILDGLYRQIKSGQFIVLAKGTELRWFQVTAMADVAMNLPAGAATNILDDKDKIIQIIEPPPISVPATQLTLDVSVNEGSRKLSSASDWANSDAPQLVLHYAFGRAGTVTLPPKPSVAPGDSLQLVQPLETTPSHYRATQFLLEDKNQQGLEASGSVQFSTGQLNLNPNPSWAAPLTPPVQVYGNSIAVTRGETVKGEILGSGDAAQSNQAFTLSKKPLTYLVAPTAGNEQGVISTLEIWVNGMRWMEVPRFFGVAPEAQVYIVRQTDAGDAVVTFGDGQRGARLPTGTDNVIAHYRYGAEAASPPAGVINQIAKPVPGLKSVRNLTAPAGGEDAEAADTIRTYAPRSALILGRAISMPDMEAVVAGIPGVRSVQVEWRWSGTRQRAVAQIFYIGAIALQAPITETLRNLTDPATPMDVKPAQAIAAHLALDLEIDPRYQESLVVAAVQAILLAPQTGLLVPERIGIGQPLYRSRLFEAVLSVAGAIAVRGIFWNDVPFLQYGLLPGAGKYFDLEQGSLWLNGQEVTHG